VITFHHGDLLLFLLLASAEEGGGGGLFGGEFELSQGLVESSALGIVGVVVGRGFLRRHGGAVEVQCWTREGEFEFEIAGVEIKK
jgi:hypothetical protein